METVTPVIREHKHLNRKELEQEVSDLRSHNAFLEARVAALRSTIRWWQETSQARLKQTEQMRQIIRELTANDLEPLPFTGGFDG